MRVGNKTIVAAAVLALVAMSFGCEDSDVTAPAGSIVTLVAQPSSVFIDQDAGDDSGQVQLSAQIIDSDGEPVADVPVFFTTSGGLLASSSNICVAGFCSLSGGACLDSDDCPDQLPQTLAVKTGTNGFAVDTVEIRLIEDPDPVEVTVHSTSLAASVSISKTVNLGPSDPVANISAIPAIGQRTGLPFTLNGSGSTFDPQVELTCFEWTVDSSDNAADQVIYNDDPKLVTLTVGDEGSTADEQDLIITLQVSDEPGPCGPGTDFGPFPFAIAYQIRCDFTDPFLEAGSNVTQSLTSPEAGKISLTAIGSDSEFPDLTYQWDCPGGILVGGNGQSVTCEYFSTGTFTATVIVQNDCGRTAVDSLIVTINP